MSRTIPIAILGRGMSLTKYPQFAHLFKKIYLVNPFTEEIDRLGEQHFKGKELVHVVSKGNDCRLKQHKLFPKTTVTANITMGPPQRGMKVLTQKIGNTNYVNFKPMPDCMKERGFPLIGWDAIAPLCSSDLSHEALIEQIEANHADAIAANEARATASTRCWPTTGLFAIELALMTEDVQVVYLFGFDCFRRGSDSYFIGRKKSHQNKDAQTVMRYYLRHLVQEFTTPFFYSADEQPHITEKNWSSCMSTMAALNAFPEHE